MTMGADDVRFGIGWWEGQREQLAGFELIPHIVRLLAEGEPVTLDQLAAASSWPVQDVESALRRHRGVDWDEQGRLVGFGLTMSLVRPDRWDDVRAETCALGHFFASREAAADWLAANPEGMVHSVEEDFRLHQSVMEKLGWAVSRNAAR